MNLKNSSSTKARQKAKQLLEEAKQKVENLIEEFN